MKLREYFLNAKKNKNNDFIQGFLVFRVSLSMEGQKALGFHQKHLKLSSKEGLTGLKQHEGE